MDLDGSLYANLSREFEQALRQPANILPAIFESLLLIVGLLGNSMVITAILTNKNMRTLVNYFVLNLSIADLLCCLIIMPITVLTYLFKPWYWGATLCKFKTYLDPVTVGASIITMTVVAFDR
ncbi:hypothetical protein Ciccas_012035 [Cichlidogyrus casuarinus]|uniref:G-protein coupled receptors family 1 profile domain-containing protein n=1 Tax=Cichlidogyrus casuarinus TaxID=1844966 RepID=A0ABD2PPJ6_9PLAT